MRAGTADTELIRAAVTLASRAPSLHNTQPWLWVAHDDALHLHLDRSRIVRNTDTGGREAVIACGAMLDHLVTAMAVANDSTLVEQEGRWSVVGEPTEGALKVAAMKGGVNFAISTPSAAAHALAATTAATLSRYLVSIRLVSDCRVATPTVVANTQLVTKDADRPHQNGPRYKP